MEAMIEADGLSKSFRIARRRPGLLRFLYRVPEQRHAANLERLRAMLALDEFIDTPMRQLSPGQRMRGDLAAPCCATRNCSTWTSRPSGWM